MIRRLTIALTLIASLGLSTPAKACLPYIPWLDPFAWMGFYGCGNYGYGGYGGGCYNSYGYGYAPYATGYNYAPGYTAPMAAPLTYPAAPQPGCNCTGSLPTTQSVAAVQVPVTTYRPVTRYVPQTTWRTQYQPQATTGYYQPGSVAYSGYPTTAYNQSLPTYNSYPAQTVYNSPPVATPTYDGSIPVNTAPQTFYPSAPVVNPGVTLPGAPVGDVAGDHEFPAQSAVVPPPVPQSVQPRTIVPVSASRYGVAPRPVRSFNAAVR